VTDLPGSTVCLALPVYALCFAALHRSLLVLTRCLPYLMQLETKLLERDKAKDKLKLVRRWWGSKAIGRTAWCGKCMRLQAGLHHTA